MKEMVEVVGRAWTFRGGTITREDGLRVVASLRHDTKPHPGLTPESLAQGMDEVVWEVAFPDRRRFLIPWRESLATPKDMQDYCDRKWL